ncbi:MAG: hypothetical protein QM778_21395 [Myxococcales bacterium]
MFRLRATLCGAVLALALTSGAQADVGDAPALHWSRSENAVGCIDPATLAERVEQLTGTSLNAPAHAARFIEGHIEAVAPGRYYARITLSERGGAPGGQRVLEQNAVDCRELDEPLVFIVAMMVDPNLSLADLPPALLGLLSSEEPAEKRLLSELDEMPPAPVPEFSPPEPAPLLAPTPKPESVRPWPPRDVRLAALAEFGVAPDPLVGASLSFASRLRRRLSMVSTFRGASGLGGMHLSQNTAVKAQAFDFVIGMCSGGDLGGRLHLRACLSPEYSLWRQKGSGFLSNDSAVLSGFGVSLGLELLVRLAEHWGLSASGAARVNALSRRFVIDHDATAFEVPRVSYVVNMGPSLLF